jgi:LysR family transcriptional regulator, mexEF-oprN operon transcriptional activator
MALRDELEGSMEDWDLRHADFRRIDLNLLVAFDAMMLERHVGKAAARVFIGQPAMSHALARLREALGDPVFIRSGNKMEPTALANQLAPSVRAWLGEANRFLFARTRLDLTQARTTIKLALIDGLETILLPRLLGILSGNAPGIRIWTKQLAREQTLAAIDAEEVDIAIGAPDLVFREWHGCDAVVKSGFDCIYSRRQLSLPHPVPLEAIAAERHVAIGWRGEDGSMIDRLFERRGLARDVITMTNSQLAIGRILSTMRMVTLQPRIYTSIYREIPDLVIEPIHDDELIMDIRLIWHRRNEFHPVHAYLRDCITGILRDEMDGGSTLGVADLR